MKELLLIKTIKLIIVRAHFVADNIWIMNFINWIIHQDVYDVVYHLVCP